ncbi:uncharacterized protein LOC112347966 isoform X2 [Selaginella moellendorffii]|uniref:uncharacterized protein LOC112347966 isoform X2 n=1 Tax=Selaginella moellendorffii TaxID=88036 RepID=UPI000D1CDAB2|nr:uncharacterized protein LOC112347966 isoform X2 [Selaginella moellendorffii]|eukprot:XP_024535539.1 uncharacterized protein LOC112347966 isoform X2 [Selaginella moellendorffii]
MRSKKRPWRETEGQEDDSKLPLSLLDRAVPWKAQSWKQMAGIGGLAGEFRVGTSGYIYKHWRGVVYPRSSAQKDWFRLYTNLFDTVEINNTFYRLPERKVFQEWHDQAPENFCYALKYSRFGTHMKRLKDPENHVNLFLDRSVPLHATCGPVLVQLPPKFKLELERLKEFLHRLPTNIRWAVEVRDSRWLCDDVYELLKQHNVALCIHDHEDIIDKHPKASLSGFALLLGRFPPKGCKNFSLVLVLVLVPGNYRQLVVPEIPWKELSTLLHGPRAGPQQHLDPRAACQRTGRVCLLQQRCRRECRDQRTGSTQSRLWWLLQCMTFRRKQYSRFWKQFWKS